MGALERGARGLLLGLLLGAAAALAEDLAVDVDVDDELAVVIGADRLDDAVLRGGAAARLHALLQLALGVAPEARSVREPLDRLAHDRAGDDARRLDAEVQVHGADDGLDGVRKHVLLRPLARGVGPASEAKRVADERLPRPRGERVRVHERRAHQRQLALARLREAIHELLAHAEAEHRVPQKFEALVVLRGALVLVRVARVRERFFEVRARPLESEADRELVRVGCHGARHYGPGVGC